MFDCSEKSFFRELCYDLLHIVDVYISMYNELTKSTNNRLRLLVSEQTCNITGKMQNRQRFYERSDHYYSHF